MTSVELLIASGSYGAAQTPGAALVDNLNLERAAVIWTDTLPRVRVTDQPS